MLGKICHKTTCHGVANVYDAKSKWRRLFWICVLLCSEIGFGYVSFKIMRSFFQSPNSNSLFFETRSGLKIPDLLVCILAPYWNHSKAEELGWNVEEVKEYFRLVDVKHLKYDPKALDDRYQYLKHKFNGVGPIEVSESLGPSVESVIVDCKFFISPSPCLISTFFDYYGRHCYLIQNPFNQTYPGIEFGGSFHVKLPPSEEPSVEDYGIQIGVYPQYLGASVGEIFFGGGVHGKVLLEMRERRLINSILKENCNASMSGRQSAFDCTWALEELRLLTKCGCVLAVSKHIFDIPILEPWAESMKQASVCSPLQISTCAHREVFTNASNNDLSCLPTCNQITYRKVVSSTSLSQENNASDSIRVSLGYQSLEVGVTQEVNTMTLESVVGNLGGALGVFLGSSLITIIELLDFGAEFLWKLRNTKDDS